MASSKRGRDDEIDRRLRAGRTELDPELSRAIADRLQSRRLRGTRGLDRVPFGAVGAFSAVLLVAVLAFGGGGSTIGTAGKALKFDNAATSSRATKAPVESQYGKRLTICINAKTTVRLPAAAARAMIALGVAVLGPCPHPVYTKHDKDGDAVETKDDNCPKLYNPDQNDVDGDRTGDACDRFPTNPDRD